VNRLARCQLEEGAVRVVLFASVLLGQRQRRSLLQNNFDPLPFVAPHKHLNNSGHRLSFHTHLHPTPPSIDTKYTHQLDYHNGD
jgi:hypothetical protein